MTVYSAVGHGLKGVICGAPPDVDTTGLWGGCRENQHETGLTPPDPVAEESLVLAGITGVSVQGRVAFGPQAGARVLQVGRQHEGEPLPREGDGNVPWHSACYSGGGISHTIPAEWIISVG